MSQRSKMVTMLVLLHATTSQLSAQPSPAPPPDGVSVETPANENTEGPNFGDSPTTIDPVLFVPKPLARSVTVEFESASLIEVAQWIEEELEIPVLLDRRSLRDDGIPLGEAVSDRLVDEPVYLLLDRFASLGLGWYVDDNVLHITTIDAGEDRYSTEPYDVSDLFNSGHEPESIIETIKVATEGLWDDVDGEGGVLEWLGDVLFVRHDPRTQRQVRGLLAALRNHGAETFCHDPPQHLALRAKLDLPVAVDFDDELLVNAIANLASQVAADIRLDMDSLREDGIREREPVSLTLSDRKLSTVLSLLLSDLRLTVMLRDGVIWVTPIESADSEMKAVVYDVSDLCTTDAETTELSNAIQDQTSGLWVDVNGEGGEIAFPIPQTMVIRHSEQSIREVRQLLTIYRKALSTATPRKKDGSDPDEIITKYYRMNADMATDLTTVLPILIQPGTWATVNNPELHGRILKVASGRDLHRDAETQADPQLIPQAVLIIRQTRAVHEEIAKALTRVEYGDARHPDGGKLKGGFGGGGGGIGIGGGAF